MDRVIGAVRQVAPILATALATPAAGFVVKLIADRLGVDAKNQDALVAAIAAPGAGDKLRSLESENSTALQLAQIGVNKEEAKSPSVFVAGWRPAIGWVCGIALGYHFIGQPMVADAAALLGLVVEFSQFDYDALYTILFGMLGLGGLRTFEKFKGVENNRKHAE